MERELDGGSPYYIYFSGRVEGPFLPDDLVRLDGFSADSMLCAEAALGTALEKWSRAANLAEFAAVFPDSLRGERLASALEAGTIGSVEGRNLIIDRSLARARSEMERRRESFDKLKNDIAERLAAVSEIQKRVRGLAVDVSGVPGVVRGVREVKAAMAMQRRRIAELQNRLIARRGRRLQTKISELETRLEAEGASAAEAVARQRERIQELERQMAARTRPAADAKIAEISEKLKSVEEELKARLEGGAPSPRARGRSRRGRRAGRRAPRGAADPFGPSDSAKDVPGL